MRFFIVLLLFGLLTACAQPPKPVWTEVPEPSALLERFATTTGQVRSLDGAATVSLTVQGKFFSSQQFLLLEKPERLRTDVLTGFGQLILQLTSDGEELSVFMNTTVPGRFYRGEATTESLARFTRIPLQAKDMVRLLLYDPPLIDFLQAKVILEKELLILQLTNQERRQELLFDDQLLLVGCRYLTDGELFLDVSYQALDTDKQFPQTIRLNMPQQKIKTALKFSEMQTNVAIPKERFRLQQPVNLPVEPLPQ